MSIGSVRCFSPLGRSARYALIAGLTSIRRRTRNFIGLEAAWPFSHSTANQRERRAMVDRTTNLDDHRGMAAQAATELRRMRAEVEADQVALRQRRNDLEK